ncbi:uncharacterized protein G2W53_040767 [Senna tora]|uniref:Uncharacterized protein n=1 Tax=Senna tora TaxID=362788 RepID=A0A834SEM1_9FABA|nr:uncharacterized protein G2W53_040767 [Senna tora]
MTSGTILCLLEQYNVFYHGGHDGAGL